MSDTPRTEQASDENGYYQSPIEMVSADFARQLERELNTAKNIIADLLEHPYPHDLIKLRLEASKYGSETSAMADMEAYCTTEIAMKERAEWKLAQETARGFLKKP